MQANEQEPSGTPPAWGPLEDASPEFQLVCRLIGKGGRLRGGTKSALRRLRAVDKNKGRCDAEIAKAKQEAFDDLYARFDRERSVQLGPKDLDVKMTCIKDRDGNAWLL